MKFVENTYYYFRLHENYTSFKKSINILLKEYGKDHESYNDELNFVFNRLEYAKEFFEDLAKIYLKTECGISQYVGDEILKEDFYHNSDDEEIRFIGYYYHDPVRFTYTKHENGYFCLASQDVFDLCEKVKINKKEVIVNGETFTREEKVVKERFLIKSREQTFKIHVLEEKFIFFFR
jgi:hypothetical protein